MKTLREAAQAVVDRWEGSLWEDAPTIAQHEGLGEEIREVFAVPKLTQDEILDMAEGVTLQFHDLLKFARAIEGIIHAKVKGNTP